MTAPAIETTEITLEDIAPGCIVKDCDHTAEWVAVTYCCGQAIFWCEEHRANYMHWAAQGMTFRCQPGCGSIIKHKVWSTVERI